MLVEYDLREINYPSLLTEPKKYISVIKYHVDRDVIKNQLFKLVDKIEKGEKWEAMSYYYILFDDIKYLDDNNLEMVLLYVINVLSESTKNKIEIENYVNLKLFSTIGSHLITEDIEKEFIKLFCNIIFNHMINNYIFFLAYDQLINSIESEKQEKIKEYILKTTDSYSTDKFYKGYNNGDYLPF